MAQEREKFRDGRERPRLLFFVTEDWYFCSHRLPHARAAKEAGFEVLVACRVREHGERIRNEGLRLVSIPFNRRSKNPFRELRTILALVRLYARERPDLVQHVALKPVLYGSLAAALAGVPRVVNSIAGLGYVFISRDLTARLLRPFIRAALRWLLNLKNGHLVLQNPDDLRMLEEAGVIRPQRATIIPGSGVDTSVFAPSPEPPPDGKPLAVLASRMLWDKGVGELVEAARILKERGNGLRVILVGDPDPGNPASIAKARLESWQAEGLVEWWGHREDMAKILRQCHIAVLPSYREGFPKSLLEAAACARAIVASDVPGCREIVRHEENGLLVPVRQAAPLADALERLAGDAGLRQRMGRKGRRMVEESFSEEIISAQTVALYRRLMGLAGGAAT